jgi:hypothetical protein
VGLREVIEGTKGIEFGIWVFRIETQPSFIAF